MRVDEQTDEIYGKVNRRLEHLTHLKTNSTLRQSEHMLVIIISGFTNLKEYMYQFIYIYIRVYVHLYITYIL